MSLSLVVDTNVLVQATNKACGYSTECRALANALIAEGATARLHIDLGYHPDPAQNSSRIAGEYFTKLVPGMLGFEVVQRLAASKRLVPTPPENNRAIRDRVKRLVSDSSDWIFLLVALATEDKILVSHDDVAFPDGVRDECRSRWAVEIWDGIDAVKALQAA